MSLSVIIVLQSLGIDVEEIEGESSRDFDSRMNDICENEYIQAKSMIKPSDKQLELCDDLIDCGACFDLESKHEKSMLRADAFIKKNYHLLKSPTPNSFRVQSRKIIKENPFTANESSLFDVHDFCLRNHPSDFSVPNH